MIWEYRSEYRVNHSEWKQEGLDEMFTEGRSEVQGINRARVAEG